MKKLIGCLGLSCFIPALAMAQVVQPAPEVASQAQQEFFKAIQAHCGKAYEGKVTVDNPASGGFEGRLVMHVRECSDRQLHIPFHVGDDHSRTWILTQTGSGISLKHDHRLANGEYDTSTMYGGHTQDAGYPQVQSFPVDVYSQELFTEQQMAASSTNIWQMYIYPNQFTYRLVREGREFRVDFDLTKPVDLPPTPWGYASKAKN